MKWILLVAAIYFLFFYEGSDSAYGRGYDDGSVVGYNSLCSPGTTNIIAGDWGNANYSRGYGDGEADGWAECRAE